MWAMKQKLEKPSAKACFSQHCEKREVRIPQKDLLLLSADISSSRTGLLECSWDNQDPAPERSTEATATGMRIRMLERIECIWRSRLFLS